MFISTVVYRSMERVFFLVSNKVNVVIELAVLVCDKYLRSGNIANIVESLGEEQR